MKTEGYNGIHIRPYATLREVDIGWLKLKDHFISTVGPHSGQGESLKNLLVIADATMKPKSSFSKHPHQNMEILTWVVRGTLHHKDDNGSDQMVSSQYLQLMSARDGIYHAEGNSSDDELRLLQIWINPNKRGGDPVVTLKPLTREGFELMAGPMNAPLIIRQDLWLFAARITKAQKFEIPHRQFGYGVFIGELKLNGHQVEDGDGAILETGEYEVSGHGQVILILQNE